METLSLPTLWLAVCPDELPAAWEDQLSEAERRWLQTLKAPQRRRQMLSARILARQALAAHFPGAAPSDISLSAGEDVAPALTGVFRGAHLSLAHSKELCACLIDSVPCGVDIEYNLAVRDFEAIAEKSFEAAQTHGWRRLAPGQRQSGFYQLWCAHEAALKSGQAAPLFYGGAYDHFSLATATSSHTVRVPVRLADLSAASSQSLPSLERFH